MPITTGEVLSLDSKACLDHVRVANGVTSGHTEAKVFGKGVDLIWPKSILYDGK